MGSFVSSIISEKYINVSNKLMNNVISILATLSLNIVFCYESYTFLWRLLYIMSLYHLKMGNISMNNCLDFPFICNISQDSQTLVHYENSIWCPVDHGRFVEKTQKKTSPICCKKIHRSVTKNIAPLKLPCPSPGYLIVRPMPLLASLFTITIQQVVVMQKVDVLATQICHQNKNVRKNVMWVKMGKYRVYK